MSLDPIKIPQNVYIEDRVVGPLTLRQTILMTIGGGISYSLYAMLQKSSNGSPDLVLSVLAWIPFVISVIFALIKINDLSMLRICLLLVERVNKASSRTWAPRTGVSINIRYSTPAKDGKVAAAVREDVRTEKRIRELSSIIDRPIEGLEEKAALIEAPLVESSGIEGATLDGISTTQRDGSAVPAQSTAVADAPAAAQERSAPLPVQPANPAQLQGPTFSDLSVFKDIFSPDK